MWRLMHKLFGWDYVAVEFASVHAIRRVKFLPDDTPYIDLHGTIERLTEDYRTNYGRRFLPLTWSPDKASDKGDDGWLKFVEPASTGAKIWITC